MALKVVIVNEGPEPRALCFYHLQEGTPIIDARGGMDQSRERVVLQVGDAWEGTADDRDVIVVVQAQ
jgi:hypothetical protein